MIAAVYGHNRNLHKKLVWISAAVTLPRNEGKSLVHEIQTKTGYCKDMEIRKIDKNNISMS